MQTSEQIQRDVQRAVRDAVDAAREASQAARDAARTGTPPGLPRDEAITVMRAEIAGTRQEIASLTEQLTPGLSHAREMAVQAQLEAATERLASQQAQLDRLVTGRSTAGLPGIAVPQRPSDIPPEAVDMTIAFFAACAVVLIGVPIARAWARWLDRRGTAPSAAPDVAPRLERIEQAIEAVAIEVERVSEGQRFSNKVMSELRGLPAPGPQSQWQGIAPREAVGVPRTAEG